MDGYALFVKDSDRAIGQVGAWPSFVKVDGIATQEEEASPCEIVLDECFGDVFMSMSGDVQVSSVMRRVAFERPTCGDCMIVQLVAKSGDQGLEAFLPEQSLEAAQEGSDEVEAIGLTKEWRTVEFGAARGSRVSLRQKVSIARAAIPKKAS